MTMPPKPADHSYLSRKNKVPDGLEEQAKEYGAYFLRKMHALGLDKAIKSAVNHKPTSRILQASLAGGYWSGKALKQIVHVVEPPPPSGWSKNEELESWTAQLLMGKVTPEEYDAYLDECPPLGNTDAGGKELEAGDTRPQARPEAGYTGLTPFQRIQANNFERFLDQIERFLVLCEKHLFE